MIITFEEYNRVISGLAQQLMLHRTYEKELKDIIKNREEMLDDRLNKMAGLNKELDAMREKVSDELAKNLSMAATNVGLFNDLQSTKDALNDTQIEVMQLRARVQRLNKLNGKK